MAHAEGNDFHGFARVPLEQLQKRISLPIRQLLRDQPDRRKTARTLMRRFRLPIMVLVITSCCFATLLAAVGDGHWRTRVPEQARLEANPLANDADAVAAGARLF